MNRRPGERLNRYLARRGVASRRAADALIDSGRVTVNGSRGRLGSVVDPEQDAVAVDGTAVEASESAVTFVLNKPVGVVSTRRDPQGRPTVMDLVEHVPGLVPVGRLDADSRGLLLLTTDGELAHRIAHPRYGVRKTYRVTLSEPVTHAQLESLREGVDLRDGAARAIAVVRGPDPRTLDMTMAEGRRREVRRMCAAVGLAVVDLVRESVGPVALGRLREGMSRRLSAREEHTLREDVALDTGANGSEETLRRAYDPSRVVTVDGPAGSGKSTLGRGLALALDLPFLDTGLFYRAVAVAATRAGLRATDASGVAGLAERMRVTVRTEVHPSGPPVLLDGAPVEEQLFDPSLAPMLAAVSAVPGVRTALLAPQRSLAAHGAVAVGRDCGTVVFPDAKVKLYLEAPTTVRSRRRAQQVRARGDDVDAVGLDAEVAGRDRADTSRRAAPLRPAADAHIIDTGSNGIDEVMQQALVLCAASGLVPE